MCLCVFLMRNVAFGDAQNGPAEGGLDVEKLFQYNKSALVIWLVLKKTPSSCCLSLAADCDLFSVHFSRLSVESF